MDIKPDIQNYRIPWLIAPPHLTRILAIFGVLLVLGACLYPVFFIRVATGNYNLQLLFRYYS